jgi:indolepyruvate ferredoxin oxidoreductase beta subunit
MNKIIAEYDKLPNKIILEVERIAKDSGAPRASNVVLLGAASPYIGIRFDKLEDGIRSIFRRKGEEIVNTNLKALKAGKECSKNLIDISV